MKKIISKNLDEFNEFILSYLKRLEKKDKATIIALSGDLGSGKTTLVKTAANYFNIKENVTSPTFVIQKEYKLDGHPLFKKMVHIDAYRLEDKKELEYLGWDEIILDSGNIIFIEWPEQVEGIDMPEANTIKIEILEGELREITIQ